MRPSRFLGTLLVSLCAALLPARAEDPPASQPQAPGANKPAEELAALPDDEKAKRLAACAAQYEDHRRNQDLLPVRTRRAAVRTAGDLRYPAAAKFLRRVFDQDRDLTTSVASMVAIGKCGDLETIEYVVKRALSDAAKRPVFAATLPRMFAAVRSSEAIDWIVTRLPPTNDDTGASLVEAVGETRSAGAVAALLATLEKSKHASVRFEALRALGKCGGKDAVAKLSPYLADPDWRMRMAAAEGVGFAGDASAIAEIKRLIVRTEEPIVVETVVEAIARLGTRAAVEPLIESLKMARLRARQKARASLRAIAKSEFKQDRDYHVDAGQWTNWWNRVKRGVDPDDPTVTARETASYFNFPIQSDRVLFILDVSGSMEWPDPPRDSGIRASAWKERRIDVAHRNLFKALRDLAAQNRGRIKKKQKGDTGDVPYGPNELGEEPPTLFNVAVFSSGVTPWQKAAVLADEKNTEAAIAWIQGILPGGGTASYDALAHGLAQPDIDSIYFLSDGVPSLGRFEERETILGELRKLNRFRRVTINTVALIIGLSPIESARKYEDPDDMADFMSRVAAEHQGTFANESKP